MKKIILATDHAGFELKEKVKEWLLKNGYEVLDFGAFEYDSRDDYPDFISKAGEEISKNPQNLGIIFGGSGQGEAMMANRFKNVRATVFYGGSREILKLSKEHNNANVLSVGARFVDQETILDDIKYWLENNFQNEERHQRRIKKIDQIIEKFYDC